MTEQNFGVLILMRMHCRRDDRSESKHLLSIPKSIDSCFILSNLIPFISVLADILAHASSNIVHFG